MPSKRKSESGWDHSRDNHLPNSATGRPKAFSILAKATKAEPDFQQFLGPVHPTPVARRTNEGDE